MNELGGFLIVILGLYMIGHVIDAMVNGFVPERIKRQAQEDRENG